MRRRSRMTPARKLACVLLAVAVVVSVVYATGAFTTTTASRSADIKVAGYGSAFLSLQPSNGPNGKFASYGSDGALQVKIGGARGGATGVNPDSKTVFKNVFTITNKGSQPVNVWITGKNPAVTFRAGSNGVSLERRKVRLYPGGRSLHVGVVIDANGVKPGADLMESITIHADPTGKAYSVKDVNDGSGPGGWPEPKQSNSKKSGSCGTWCDVKNVGEYSYDVLASIPDTVLLGGDEWAHKRVTDFVNAAEAGYNDIKEAIGEAGDAIVDFIRKEVSDLLGFIDKRYSTIKKHADQLRSVARATPGFLDDMMVWVLLHPERLLELSLGALLGATGMPKGALPVEESSSPLYFVGWMVGSFVPVVDILADLRDTVQALANGKIAEAALGAAALVPGAGKISDTIQIPVYVSKWLGAFPVKKADDLFKMVKSGLLSRLPSNAKQKLLNALPDSVTGAVNKAKDMMPNSATSKADDTDSRRVVAGPGGIPDEVAKHIDKGDNRQLVEKMLDEGVSVDHMNFYLKNDIRLDTVNYLMKHKSKKRTYKIMKTWARAQGGAGAVGMGLTFAEWYCQSETKQNISLPFMSCSNSNKGPNRNNSGTRQNRKQVA